MTTILEDQEGRSRRGRPPAESNSTRRKQTGSGELTGQRLAVPKSMLDLDRFKYRWINDDEARLFAKTKEDDWDIVSRDGSAIMSDDLGAAVAKVVGTRADGKPQVAYLCRKPKNYFDEDQAAKSAVLDRQMTELKRGNDRTGNSQADYIPASGIRMDR